MQLDIEFGKSLCYTSKFIINGVKAKADDFGEMYDRNPDKATELGDYTCGDMRFTRNGPRHDVLAKYRISEAEYHTIAAQLEEGLSFGCCGWCT